MTRRSAWTRPRRSVTWCRSRTRRCLSARPSIELRPSGTMSSSRLLPGRTRARGRAAGGPGSGLYEHVLALSLVAGDGHLAALVVAVAAAQLELRTHLVEGAAGIGRNRARRHGDAQVDVARLAAVPVTDLQLGGVGQDVGEVEVRTITDGGEADVEAPGAADAVPKPPLEVDAEPDLEGVGALDDGVVDVLVVDVEDVGVPVRPQVPPGRQQDLGGAVEPVGQFRRDRCRGFGRRLSNGCG